MNQNYAFWFTQKTATISGYDKYFSLSIGHDSRTAYVILNCSGWLLSRLFPQPRLVDNQFTWYHCPKLVD